MRVGRTLERWYDYSWEDCALCIDRMLAVPAMAERQGSLALPPELMPRVWRWAAASSSVVVKRVAPLHRERSRSVLRPHPVHRAVLGMNGGPWVMWSYGLRSYWVDCNTFTAFAHSSLGPRTLLGCITRLFCHNIRHLWKPDIRHYRRKHSTLKHPKNRLPKNRL